MATRRKGKKAAKAAPPGDGGDASEAWLAIPVDESAIQGYQDADLEGEARAGAEAPTAGDGAAPEPDAGGGDWDGGSLAFPLEETYGRSDTQEGVSSADSLDLLCFELANETFAIDIRRVREIIRRRPATELPGVADYISGIIALRGFIVPVLDLRRRLGFAKSDTPMPEARIIVMNVDQKPAGIFVDSVSQKIRLPRSSMVPPPAVLGNAEAAYLLGICRHQGRLISVLNPERVMGVEVHAGESGAEAGAGEAA